MARVIYRHVKDASSQRLQLEKGDVDIARNLSPEHLTAISGNKDIKTTSTTQECPAASWRHGDSTHQRLSGSHDNRKKQIFRPVGSGA